MYHRPGNFLIGILTSAIATHALAGDLRDIPLQSRVVNVQPMTGIVLWNTNEDVAKAPIQLEFAYLKYDLIVEKKGHYDWEPLEKLLNEIAGRSHQAVIRWHDTYVGQPTGVPAYIKALPNYRETTAPSENEPTGFPDWSNSDWQEFVIDFFTQFSAKYDQDPRIAFVEVGFGLWGEYHIYDGPMTLGKTFPSREFQARFARHLGESLRRTPWMISVDAAGDHAPFAGTDLLSLPFGVFDDSFNHARHKEENEPNWNTLGRDRWKRAPAGGEFSFFEPKDQKQALAPNGPHGIAFERQAARFHLSFIIGDAQPGYQSAQRIRAAGLACGYRFRVTRFVASTTAAEVTIKNTGIAPIYYDAYPAIDGVRSQTSLKGLLPGESRHFAFPNGGAAPTLMIESDRLVKGQKIEFDADLR